MGGDSVGTEGTKGDLQIIVPCQDLPPLAFPKQWVGEEEVAVASAVVVRYMHFNVQARFFFF